MIVIPMLGLSRRFFEAGYTLPKYQLEIAGQSVFALALQSFRHYFSIEEFLFIVRSDFMAADFVAQQARHLGILHYRIVTIAQNTAGQAETVFLGVQDTHSDTPLLIFNIDTIRHDYRKPPWIDECDGYLEVFVGEGDHWSFVEPGPSHSVLSTTEKNRISNLCSNGLYYFRSRALFDSVFLHAKTHQQQVHGEYYIAPLYNTVITNGGKVRYVLVPDSQLDFCGTPAEYEALLATTS